MISLKVIASIRPTSFEKLSVKELAASGVEIRSSDIEADSQDQLKELLNGVDVLVIAVQLSTDQKPLLRAAKDVGTIKRVLPSEWTWDAPHGSIHLNDEVSDCSNCLVVSLLIHISESEAAPVHKGLGIALHFCLDRMVVGTVLPL